MSSQGGAVRLHVVDYIVLAAVLCISMGIGIYYGFFGKKQRTTKEYLMANRQLKVCQLKILTVKRKTH